MTAEWGALDYGIPPALGGKAGRTNPEEMLLGAVAACYSLTLAVLAERRRLPIARIELSGEAEVVRQMGGTLKLTRIRLAPKIIVEDGDESLRAAVNDMAHKAEQYCVISNAIRGNVEIVLEPEIVIE